MKQEIIARAQEIVALNTVKGDAYQGEVCVLTLIGLDGYPSASVITAAKADGIKRLWFCSNLDSEKVKQIRKNNRANVCFGSDEHSVSLTGEIEILTDAAVKQEVWYKGVEGFYAGGIVDPLYCVLLFTAKRYDIFLISGEKTRGTPV